jgi:hypothetical protein
MAIRRKVSGGLNYLGTWDADTNTPNLSDGSGSNGDYYIVSVAGITTIDGESDWDVGDWIIANDTKWQKIDNTDAKSLNDLTDVAISLLQNDDLLRYNSDTSLWENESQIESYLPYLDGKTIVSEGKKGQWSFGDGVYWVCIGSDTWISLTTAEQLNEILALYSLVSEKIESFVPANSITDQDSTGVKGQWSYSAGYRYDCIATNTWIRQAVATTFTK